MENHMSNNHDEQILDQILTYLKQYRAETREYICDSIFQGKERARIQETGRLEAIIMIINYVTSLRNEHANRAEESLPE